MTTLLQLEFNCRFGGVHLYHRFELTHDLSP
jgi:hypothetical protein